MNGFRRLLRDRSARLGLIVIAGLVFCAVFAGVLAPFPEDVNTYHLPRRLLGPGGINFLGTDRMGADIFSRLLFGARLTILTAVVATTFAVLIGVPIGLIAGYYNNRLSDLLMRVSDVFLAVPQIVLAIAIAQTLGPAIHNVILALSITYWPFWARLVYAETRSVRNEVFVEAAVAIGASPLRVMALHILPSIASSVIVRTTIGLGGTILVAAALGFLGLGPPPPTPEWGRMIAESREFLPQAWWYAAAPGVAILLVVMGFNLLGDGLRDALDPRLSRGTDDRTDGR
ncbi:MAG: ABC transporter permease [Acetobacteraceae bacterium]|nr:ABC transporter permease [Acetobacteraceae bacterium]